MNDRYLTPAEAAERLRISPDTVLRLIASGELAALRVSPRIIRIPVPAFEAFRTGDRPKRRPVVRRSSKTEPRIGESAPVHEQQPA